VSIEKDAFLLPDDDCVPASFSRQLLLQVGPLLWAQRWNQTGEFGIDQDALIVRLPRFVLSLGDGGGIVWRFCWGPPPGLGTGRIRPGGLPAAAGRALAVSGHGFLLSLRSFGLDLGTLVRRVLH